jgi:hypothetical protein
MRTQVWAAQQALYDQIDNANLPQRVTVGLGAPGRLETDHVWVSGEIDDWTADYRTSGLAAKDETFDLRVHVYVQRLGGYADSRARLQTLGEAVEDAIGSDHTLDGTVMLATIRRSQVEETVLDDGRSHGVLLTMWVRCDAHVVPAPPTPPTP